LPLKVLFYTRKFHKIFSELLHMDKNEISDERKEMWGGGIPEGVFDQETRVV
jgi:hypothetical protein